MNIVCPKCRTRLSAEDLDFIRATLAQTSSDSIALESLMLDPEILDSILDHENLKNAIQDQILPLQISAHLYFYVLVRHTLLNADLDDRDLADYVASLLVAFTKEDRQKKLLPELKAPLHYLVDIVTEIEKADYYHRFFSMPIWETKLYFYPGCFPIS